jgi:hypothetical protein
VKIWISQDAESGELFMWDRQLGYSFRAGPFEISNELYERIVEADREVRTIQDILGSLVYDWKSSEGPGIDCD